MVEGDYSEPEPDISVVHGKIEDFDQKHPVTAALVVEVAKTSLPYDTGIKQHLYASMGVPDYWVLDLNGHRLLVSRQPIVDPSAPFGHRYQSSSIVDASGRVTPVAAPHVQLAVADMLPPAAGTNP